MAKAELGKKRVCLSCNMRFYDFNRSPIICPGCGAAFDPQGPLKNQKKFRVPQVETKPDEPTVEAVAVNEVDASDDMDFVDDDIDDKDGPGIIQDEIGDDDELLPNLDTQDE